MKTPESDYVFAKACDGIHCEVHRNHCIVGDAKWMVVPLIRIENVYNRVFILKKKKMFYFQKIHTMIRGIVVNS